MREHLSDRRPPQEMADSLTVLLEAPPEIVAREIHVWACGEPGPASLTDHLSDGIRGVLALGSLQRVPSDRLTPFVRRVGEALLTLVPPLDRNRLVALVSLLPLPAGAGGFRGRGEGHDRDSRRLPPSCRRTRRSAST